MKRILVVDDSLSVRKVLERLLSAHANVSVAASAEDALVQLAGGMPMPDLLISDVLMPGMGGLELARLLKSRTDTVRIPMILISGVLDNQLELQAKSVGIEAVIRKPFTAEELLPIITRALAMPSAITGPQSPNGQVAGRNMPQTAPIFPGDASSPLQSRIPDLSDTVQAREPNPFSVREVQPPEGASPDQVAPGTPAGTSDTVTSNPTHLELLTTLMKKPGVTGATIMTRDGLVTGSDGALDLPLTDLAMYARFFSSSAAVLSRHLGEAEHKGIQIDFTPRTLLILPLGDSLLVCMLADANSNSMVRFALRRYLDTVPVPAGSCTSVSTPTSSNLPGR